MTTTADDGLELDSRPRTNVDGTVECIDRHKASEDGGTRRRSRSLQCGDSAGLEPIVAIKKQYEFTRGGGESVIASLGRAPGNRPEDRLDLRSSSSNCSNNLSRRIGRTIIHDDNLLDLGLQGRLNRAGQSLRSVIGRNNDSNVARQLLLDLYLPQAIAVNN